METTITLPQEREGYRKVMHAYRSGLRAQKYFLEDPNPYTYYTHEGTYTHVVLEGKGVTAPARVKKSGRISTPICDYNLLEGIAFAIGVQTAMETRKQDITTHTH